MVTINTEVIKNGVAYIRVSTDRQSLGFSPDSQREETTHLAKSKGYALVKEFYDDETATTTNRIGLQELIAYCSQKKNNIEAVFVYSLSRLNRNTKDFLEIKLLLGKYGIKLYSCLEPSGEDTPTERAIQTIISAVNQLDSENKAIIVQANMKKRFMEGYDLGKPKIGYVSATIDNKRVRVPDKTWFPIVQRMWYRIKDEKLTLAQATRELNRLEIRKFSKQYVSKIFNSKFYMGIIQSAKYGEVEGKHQKMIDENTFYQVRYIISGNKPKTIERHHLREDFALRGILNCKCGNKLTAAWSKGRNKKYPYYSCPSRGKHKIISYNADKLREKFVDLLKQIKPTKEMMTFVKEMLREKYEAKFNKIQHSTKIIEQDLKQINDSKLKLMEKHLSGVYSDEDFLKMKDSLDQQYIVKKGLLSEKQIDKIDIETVLQFITFYMTNLDRVWADASPEGKLAIAGSIFPLGITVENGELRTATLGLAYDLSNFTVNDSTAMGIRTPDSWAENPMS
jgi:site-specific DNA recombinase